MVLLTWLRKQFFAIVFIRLVWTLQVNVEKKVLYHSILLSQSTDRTEVPIVILHGLLGSMRNFQTWARILQQKCNSEHDIICLDLRNHGRSAMYGSLPIDYETMSHDVLHTLDALGVKSCHIVGHSMGGKAAASAALKDKRDVFKSLTILDISPIAYSAQDFTSVIQTVQKLNEIKALLDSNNLSKNQISALISESFPDPSLSQFIMSNLVKTNTGFRWNFHVDMLEKHLDDIISFQYDGLSSQIPTLVLKAANSDFVKTAHVPLFSKLFPQYSLATVRNAGHWLHFEQPEQSAEKVAMFITAVKGTTSRLDFLVK